MSVSANNKVFTLTNLTKIKKSIDNVVKTFSIKFNILYCVLLFIAKIVDVIIQKTNINGMFIAKYLNITAFSFIKIALEITYVITPKTQPKDITIRLDDLISFNGSEYKSYPA